MRRSKESKRGPKDQSISVFCVLFLRFSCLRPSVQVPFAFDELGYLLAYHLSDDDGPSRMTDQNQIVVGCILAILPEVQRCIEESVGLGRGRKKASAHDRLFLCPCNTREKSTELFRKRNDLVAAAIGVEEKIALIPSRGL